MNTLGVYFFCKFVTFYRYQQYYSKSNTRLANSFPTINNLKILQLPNTGTNFFSFHNFAFIFHMGKKLFVSHPCPLYVVLCEAIPLFHTFSFLNTLYTGLYEKDKEGPECLYCTYVLYTRPTHFVYTVFWSKFNEHFILSISLYSCSVKIFNILQSVTCFIIHYIVFEG